nr:thioesterase family protein [uncultured Limnohabitans sp.]
MHGLVQQVVAYVDTDAGGIMYHSRYIELAERSRLQWVLDKSMSFETIAKEHDTLLVVHKLSAIFHAVAKLEEELYARTTLIKISAARSRWQTNIYRGSKLITTVTADVVAVSAVQKKLARLPAALIDIFSAQVSHFTQKS